MFEDADAADPERRAAYKKATVKINGKDADKEKLDYKWYKYPDYIDITQAQYNAGSNIFPNTWLPREINTDDFDTKISFDLKDAGICMLDVTYDEVDAYGRASVYFYIEKQQLRVEYGADPLPDAFYGQITAEYITNNQSDFKHTIKKLPNNTGTDWQDAGVTLDRNIWQVEEKAPADPPAESVWSKLPYNDMFEQLKDKEDPAKPAEKQNEYRL